MYPSVALLHPPFAIIFAIVAGADIVPQPSGGLHGNSDYFWSPGDGQIVNALQVVVNVDTDFLFQTDFGFQLNRYPPAGHRIVYQQFTLTSPYQLPIGCREYLGGRSHARHHHRR